jgi:hypothetical protein
MFTPADELLSQYTQRASFQKVTQGPTSPATRVNANATEVEHVIAELVRTLAGTAASGVFSFRGEELEYEYRTSWSNRTGDRLIVVISCSLGHARD